MSSPLDVPPTETPKQREGSQQASAENGMSHAATEPASRQRIFTNFCWTSRPASYRCHDRHTGKCCRLGQPILLTCSGSLLVANRGPGKQWHIFFERQMVGIPCSVWHHGCPRRRPIAGKGRHCLHLNSDKQEQAGAWLGMLTAGSCECFQGARNTHTREGYNDERQGKGH